MYRLLSYNTALSNSFPFRDSATEISTRLICFTLQHSTTIELVHRFGFKKSSKKTLVFIPTLPVFLLHRRENKIAERIAYVSCTKTLHPNLKRS